MKPVLDGVVGIMGSTRNLPVHDQYEMVRFAITNNANLMTTIRSLVGSVDQDRSLLSFRYATPHVKNHMLSACIVPAYLHSIELGKFGLRYWTLLRTSIHHSSPFIH